MYSKHTILNDSALVWATLLMAVAVQVGCTPEPQFRANNLEWYKQEKLAGLEDGTHFEPVHFQDVSDIMTAWFGTPDRPFFPLISGEEDPASALVSAKWLVESAGAVSSDRVDKHQGLYREHCAHCHGISGDGAGPTASFLNPYPRDFRLSKFKFKSTPTGTPPTKDDLKKILRNGIPGTAMPSFRLLKDDELEALSDYVTYLSVRGSVERFLIASVRELGDDVPRMVSLPNSKRLSDLLLEKSGSRSDSTKAVPVTSESEGGAGSGNVGVELSDAESTQAGPGITVPALDEDVVLEELDYLSEDYLSPVTGKWMDSLQFEDETPDAPSWVMDAGASVHKEKVELGHKLYFGQANCKQCHGETSLGDGQLSNYDDWANDWLKIESVNPEDPEATAPYITVGALPPRPILPRNLRTGVYRGGDDAKDIFRRIKYGIEGTPMPASLTLTEDEIWALVAFVRQLPYQTLSRPKTEDRLTNEKSIR